MSSFISPSSLSVIELQGHRESIVFVLWIDSKKLLATASEDKSIRLWDVVTRKVVKCFCRCFDADIDAMYYFPTISNALLVSSGDKLISLDLANNVLIDSTPLSVFSCPSEISSLALTLPADRVSIGDDEGNIRFYSVHSEDGIQFRDLNIVLEGAHKSIVSHLLHYERGGRMFMLSSSYDCSCVLWTVDEGVFEVKALARVDFAHLGEVQGQMFNPPFVNMVIEMDEDFLLVALGDGSVRVIRKQDLLVMTSHEFHNHQTIALQRMGESYFSVGNDI
jgi:WD40 repeat protein